MEGKVIKPMAFDRAEFVEREGNLESGIRNPESGIRNPLPFVIREKSFRIYNIFLYLFFSLNYRILSRKSQKSS